MATLRGNRSGRYPNDLRNLFTCESLAVATVSDQNGLCKYQLTPDSCSTPLNQAAIKHLRPLNRALKFASLNQFACPTKGYRYAAILVIGGVVRIVGYNNPGKTHPYELESKSPEIQQPYLHAETHAVIQALNKLSTKDLMRSKFYVARLDINGQPALAQPCSGCICTLQRAGLRHIIYSVSSSEIASVDLSNPKLPNDARI
jgi:tRNA(Arg) A34 adenosine deaminase TadA